MLVQIASQVTVEADMVSAVFWDPVDLRVLVETDSMRTYVAEAEAEKPESAVLEVTNKINRRKHTMSLARR